MSAKNLNTKCLSASEVEQIKALIRDELHSHSTEPSAQKDFAMGRLKELEYQTTPHDFVKRFVLIIHILAIHEKNGGLRREEIDQLLKLAEAILQHLEITPLRSRLAGLHGDLYLARSLIQRSRGDHWQSLWDYQLAKHFSGAYQPGTTAYQDLAAGLRFHRLGFLDMALSFLERAEAGDLDPRLQNLCRIHRVRMLRLSRQAAAAKQLIASTKESILARIDSEGYKHFWVELEWEEAWLTVTETDDPSPLISKALNRKGEYYSASYVFEAMLIAYAHESRQWLNRFPKVESLYRHNRIKISSRDILYKACQALEYLYEPGISTGHKLQKLRLILEQVDEFRNVDKVLLVYLAATRWLIRANQYLLAKALLHRYRQLSLSTSGNLNNDATGLAGELEQRDWHQNLMAGG